MEGTQRIAVSADDPTGLDSVVSPHFGRCPWFVLVDVDGCEVDEVKAVENPYFRRHQPGQVPGFIKEQAVDVMLTGGMGHRAIKFFEEYDIQPVTGASGTVRRSLEAYLGGSLLGAAPCRESVEHGHGDEGEAAHTAAEGAGYEKDEVERLREEAQMLQQQLDEVVERLGEMSDDARQER